MTYDLETNRFVFEFPGGNILAGEIIAATDAQLDLSLRVTGGRILFSFNRRRNTMIWPGMPAGELGRHLLQHTCTEVSGRTMLSTFRQPEQFDPKRLDPVDAFSLTCPGNTGPFFITLDRATKIVVVETEHTTSLLSGNITGIDNGVIKFTIWTQSVGRPLDALWDERNLSLTFIGVPNDPTGPTKVQQCTVTKPRSIMVYYDEWARRGK